MTINEIADFVGRDHPEVQNFLRALVRNPSKAGIVRRGLVALCRKTTGVDPDNPPAFLPPRRLPEEGILVGMSAGSPSRPVRLPLRVFQLPILVAGAPGTGKSRLIFHIACELIRRGIKLLIFDVSGEYRSLCRVFGMRKIPVVNHAQIRLNPLEPIGDPLEHITRLLNIFWQSFFIRHGGSHVLCEEITKMYEERGIFAGGSNFPTLRDLQGRLEKLINSPQIKPGTRKAGWIESLIRVRSDLQLFEGFNAKNSSGFRKLLQGSAILDVSGLSGGVPRDFFVQVVLGFVEAERKEKFAQDPDLVAILDEAYNFFSYLREKQMNLEEPLPVKSVRSTRKRGMGWVLGDQDAARLPGSLLSCIQVTISFRTGGPQSTRTIQYLTGLPNEMVRHLTELDVREAIVQSAVFGQVFQITVPEIAILPPPSDEEIRSRMRPILKEIFPEEPEPSPTQNVETESESEKTPKLPAWLTLDVRKVLRSIAAYPFYWPQRRAEDLGFSSSAELACRQTLINYGLVRYGGEFANRRALYILTPKGEVWCKELGIPVYRYKSNIEHEACRQALIKSILQASAKITSSKSFAVEGVQVDVALGLPAGGRLVAQVCWSENYQREARALVKLSSTQGVDKVVLCGKDKTHSEAVRRAVKNECQGEIPTKLIFITSDECISNKVDWKTLLSEFDV